MFKGWIACIAFVTIVHVAGFSPAVAQSGGNSRDKAIAECRAEGFGRSGASADATRQAMQACVKRKMQKKK